MNLLFSIKLRRVPQLLFGAFGFMNNIIKIERWRPIWFTNAKYQVSNFGRIKSVYTISKTGKISFTGTILKPHINDSGYFKIALSWKNDMGKNIRKKFAVHRLVAAAFHLNPDNKPEVNHKDLNKLNNHFRNLEWVTPKENTVHAQEAGARKKRRVVVKNPINGNCKPVKNIITGEIFPNAQTVVQMENISSLGYFWRQLRGERPNPYPYRYA